MVHCPYGAWPSQCYNYYDNDSHALKEYDKASKYQDAEDAKAQLPRPPPRLEGRRRQAQDEKLAEAAVKAKKAAEDAAAAWLSLETFKDYLDKWVYSVKDQRGAAGQGGRFPSDAPEERAPSGLFHQTLSELGGL